MALAALPRRDAAAREHLDNLGRQSRPVVLARDRAVGLSGDLGELVPGGALVRGSVLCVESDGPGTGSTSVAFELAAAVTAVGEWAAAIDLDGTLGALAAREAGVALDRFAVVRRVPPSRWATVVAALLDGVSLVLAEVPRGIGAADARRLVARARERDAILVVCAPAGRWQAGAALTLSAESSAWAGLDDAGFLRSRSLARARRGRAARPLRVRERSRASSRGGQSERASVACGAPTGRSSRLALVSPSCSTCRWRSWDPTSISGSSSWPGAGGVGRSASRRSGAGLRRREAEARCAELTVVDADDAADARAFETVVRAVEQLVPQLVLDRPGSLLVSHARSVALLRR